MFKMIIIDDEASTANELAHLIDYTKYSFEVIGCFEETETAIDFIKSNHVDLVISDIKMPGITGIDLLIMLNKTYPNIKVILISAYRDFEYAKLAVSYNAFEYITKPIVFDEYLDALERLKEILQKQEESYFYDKEQILDLEKIINDYFNNATSEEIFTNKMLAKYLNPEIMNSECSLLELSINDIDNYLDNVWLHGKDRLFSAVKQIIPTSIFDCLIFIIAEMHSSMQIVVISNNNTKFDKSINDLVAYIKSELQSLLSIDSAIIEKKHDVSIIKLKETISISISYLVNSTMSHIVNNEFDKITEIRNTFFKSASLEEQQKFCIQISEVIKKHYKDDKRFTPICGIGLKSLTSPATLLLYFDELIDAYKHEDVQNNLQKDIILEAIRYIDANYSKDITLSSISKHVMLNPSYFSNFFRKQTGECFSNFLLKIRMEKAKLLLRNNTGIKISSICSEIGYKSQPYFYKTFYAYTGFSPAEYRKSDKKQ